MATETTNYGFTLISLNDAPPDITVLNDNFTEIDSLLKTVDTTIENISNASFEVATDLHNITESKIVQCNSSTQNTPYKNNLTQAAHGLCVVSVSGNYKTLFYVCTGANNPVYIQSCINGVWNNWQTIAPTAVFPSNTVYVSTDGSDTTGNGTQETPYATLTKALSVIPKNLGGRTITINIDSGTYSDSNILVTGFYGGVLKFQGVQSDHPVFTNGFLCNNNEAELNFQYIDAKSTSTVHGFKFTDCANAQLNYCNVTGATAGEGFGIYSAHLSRVYCNECVFTNTYSALACERGDIMCGKATGTGNKYACFASAGGKIGIHVSVPSYTVAQYLTTYGGRIYKDAQINTPLY